MFLNGNGSGGLSAAHPLAGAVHAELVDNDGRLRMMDLRHLRCKPKPNDPARHLLGRKTNYTVQWEYYVVAHDAWMIVPDAWMERIFIYYEPSLLKKPIPLSAVTVEALHEALEGHSLEALDAINDERQAPDNPLIQERDLPPDPTDEEEKK